MLTKYNILRRGGWRYIWEVDTFCFAISLLFHLTGKCGSPHFCLCTIKTDLPHTQMLSGHGYWQCVAGKSLPGKFKLDWPAKICNNINRPFSTIFLATLNVFMIRQARSNNFPLVLKNFQNCILPHLIKAQDYIMASKTSWRIWKEYKVFKTLLIYPASNNGCTATHLGMTLPPIWAFSVDPRKSRTFNSLNHRDTTSRFSQVEWKFSIDSTQ